jgi:hypothetical protein
MIELDPRQQMILNLARASGRLSARTIRKDLN